jgi:macrolide transport system ATP-binding/permease protein
VGQDYFTVKGTKLAQGRVFDAEAVHGMDQVAVIDDNTRKALFGEDGEAVGKVILVGTVPCRVIGVAKPQQGGFGSSENLSIYLPFTTVQVRFLGSASLRSVTVRVDDGTAPDLAEQAVTQLLTLRHGTRDFHVLNTDDIRQTITSATRTMTFMIASIAVISLVVGGIGVMNIMLVSVSERVAEIGVRMAVGARRGDILQQFLIEAVLVCLIGGVIGIAAAFGLGAVISAAGSGVSMIYSPESVAAAVLCSTLIGLAFGYLPARSASLLDPAAALSRD